MKVTINYRIIATGETLSKQITQAEIALKDDRLYVEVWPNHYAELELAQPRLGWVVYPD